MCVPPPLPRREAASFGEPAAEDEDEEPVTPRVSEIHEVGPSTVDIEGHTKSRMVPAVLAVVVVAAAVTVAASAGRGERTRPVEMLEALPLLPTTVVEAGLREAREALDRSKLVERPLQLPPARRTYPKRARGEDFDASRP